MKIGWIGTGVMGRSMALHLRKAGYELTVFNRTQAKAQDLLDAGAQWADSPAAVSAQSDVVFTIVGFPNDVEQTYLGDDGILGTSKNGQVTIDMTTSTPSLAKQIHTEAASRGVASLDAPVSGGDIGARSGTLAIMVGGEQTTFDTVFPLFQLMGQNISLMGGPGAGQHTKMCNQTLIAGTMIGVCEALLYAATQGLDQQAVIDIIGKGAAGSWSINNLGPRIAQGDHDPGFFVEHFVKDMGIALSEAAACNLSLPGLSLVHQLYVALKAQGGGRMGTQALIVALERLNGQQ